MSLPRPAAPLRAGAKELETGQVVVAVSPWVERSSQAVFVQHPQICLEELSR